MNSKIGSILSVNKVMVSENRQQNRSNGSNASSGKQSVDGMNDDSVAITDVGQKMIEVEKEIAASPVVNRARIDEIKAAIADGSFRPDAEKIAAKLVELEIDLTGK